jgi:transposase-like protein
MNKNLIRDLRQFRAFLEQRRTSPRYTEEEVQMVQQRLKEGRSVRSIAEDIGRTSSGVRSLIRRVL